MALYAIKLVTTIENKEKGITKYETETLPFVYKSYAGVVEAIKGFVKAQVKESGYTAIDEHSCEFNGVYFNYNQNYLVNELIEMD